ncbi:Hypothetical protein D9617_14g076780 [Elsinoe fawcettii]|nr:Hypothetical protein D9617_14g076780 [Elsinoe fawcettii]
MEDPFGDSPTTDAPSSDATSTERLDFLRNRLFPDRSNATQNEVKCPLLREDVLMTECQTPPPPAKGILDLPKNVLQDILCMAGIPDNTRINVNYGKRAPDRDPNMDEWWFDEWRGEDQRAFVAKDVRSILRTCRKFYRLSTEWLYRENHIVIHWRNGKTLDGLANLSDRNIGHLRKILIVLNSSSPTIDTMHTAVGPDIKTHRVDEPLTSKAKHYNDMLIQWGRLAARLKQHLPPNTIWLDFICDCADVETAWDIMEHLSPAPFLRHCFIRLSHKRRPALQKLAREVALKSVRKLHDSYGDPFPFLRLPSEIRQLILEYTDLVTPRQEIEWNPTEKFHIRSLAGNMCERCMSYLCHGGDHPKTLHWFLWGVHGRNARTFCNHWCSAFEASSGTFFSPVSPTCLCWHQPVDLFLVSKEFTEDARATFYRRNRFIIKPVGDVMKPAYPNDGRTEISRFLSEQVPTSALHALKRIEIVYPFFEEFAHFTRTTEAANADLRNTLRMVKPHLNIPNLSISMDMADYTTYRPVDVDVWHYANVPPEATDKIMENQTETVKCWDELADGGLQRLYVILHRPWNWGNTIEPDDHVWPTLVTNSGYSFEVANEIAMRMERKVLGESYNSLEVGKRELPKTMWKLRVEFTDW